MAEASRPETAERDSSVTPLNLSKHICARNLLMA